MWDWLDNLLGFGSQLGADIIAFLQWLLDELIAVFEFLYTLVAWVFQFFYTLGKDIGAFFEHIWNDWLKGIVQSIVGAVEKVHAWLESVLGPVIDVIKSIIHYVNWVYATFVKPILNLLSKIRQFLNILAALNISWAKTLDQWIGRIQSDINRAFNTVLGYLNTALGILNALADPLGLFRKPTLVMSIRRIWPSFMRGFTGLPLGYFFPSPKKNAPLGMGPTQFPFDPASAAQNPPPSTYAGYDDGLGDFSGFLDGITPDDTAMDGMSVADYFDPSAYPDPTYSVPSEAGANLMATITSKPLLNYEA